MNGSVLLVGSVPGETAAEVMRTCAEGIGRYLSCLPDGETGYRRVWIMFLAATIYHGHPALETVQRPQPLAGQDNWLPQSREDFWRFKIKDGVDAVSFEHLGYAHEAQQSYQDFCALRAAGVIPSGVRFQVALPLTESATLRFLTNDRDFALMASAYEEAMGREIAHIISAIPPDDLVIQWDIAVEVISIETQDRFRLTWQPAGDPGSLLIRWRRPRSQAGTPWGREGCLFWLEPLAPC
jgi:hypothetical protein